LTQVGSSGPSISTVTHFARMPVFSIAALPWKSFVQSTNRSSPASSGVASRPSSLPKAR